MPRKKPTTIYRHFLKDALGITLERKTLWVFGIFAALISTGGVMDTAVTALRRAKSGGLLLQDLMHSSFFGYDVFSQYVSQVVILGSTKVTLMVIFSSLVGIGLFVAAIISQASLVHGIKSPSHKHPRLVRKHSLPHFWDIFVVDMLTKIVSCILLVITTLPVFWYFMQTSTYSTSVVFIQLVLFIPAVIVLNIISILSIIHIVHANENAYEGIRKAFKIFSKQWVATFEFAFLLFITVMLAVLTLLVAVLLLGIPFSILYSATLFSGSLALFFIFQSLVGLFIFALLLAFGGAVVTFQYAAWYQFYIQVSSKTHKHKSLSKIVRSIHK